MAEPLGLFDLNLPPIQPEHEAEFEERPVFKVAPFPTIDASPAELTVQVSATSTCVRLDLEDLKLFERVEQQYRQWGVTFSNAIAVSPSNPAFPTYSGSMVLVGSPKDGWLEAKFDTPVQFVSGFVTGSRKTVIEAFDKHDRPIARNEISEANLANGKSTLSPNAQLSLTAKGIHRVTFHTFDGQLTLDDFTFSY